MIGLDVFKDFLIRLDAPARSLELLPFPDEPQGGSAICPGCLRAYRSGSLLLVRGTINGRADGYFVIDSGSRYTMLSCKLVPQPGSPATFHGAQGDQDVSVPSSPVNIRLGDKHLVDFEYATFDTSEISSRNGVEISGAIGYSLIRNFALTVDFRHGLVNFTKSGRE